MAEPFLGQIVMFGGNFAPRGWALCDGQLLAISQFTALFSILGTTYGGDGRTTFALPDLRGRYAMHAGNGPGLSPRRLGERSGTETNTLTTNNLPAHNHAMNLASVNEGDTNTPSGNVLGVTDDRNYIAGSGASMGPTGNTGASQAVNNIPPFTAVNFIIAIQGTFPSRS